MVTTAAIAPREKKVSPFQTTEAFRTAFTNNTSGDNASLRIDLQDIGRTLASKPSTEDLPIEAFRRTHNWLSKIFDAHTRIALENQRQDTAKQVVDYINENPFEVKSHVSFTKGDNDYNHKVLTEADSYKADIFIKLSGSSKVEATSVNFYSKISNPFIRTNINFADLNDDLQEKLLAAIPDQTTSHQ